MVIIGRETIKFFPRRVAGVQFFANSIDAGRTAHSFTLVDLKPN
jgi:hypothetical protein